MRVEVRVREGGLSCDRGLWEGGRVGILFLQSVCVVGEECVQV